MPAGRTRLGKRSGAVRRAARGGVKRWGDDDIRTAHHWQRTGRGERRGGVCRRRRTGAGGVADGRPARALRTAAAEQERAHVARRRRADPDHRGDLAGRGRRAARGDGDRRRSGGTHRAGGRGDAHLRAARRRDGIHAIAAPRRGGGRRDPRSAIAPGWTRPRRRSPARADRARHRVGLHRLRGRRLSLAAVSTSLS